MKLIYLHQYFTFPEASGGTRSYDLSKEFVKNGIDVTVVTSNAGFKNIDTSRRWTFYEREGIKFWVLRNEYNHMMSIPRRILSFFQFVYYATIKCISLKADTVLATSTPLTIAIPAIIKKWVSKTPFVFEVRDVWPEGPIQQGYVKNKFLIWFLRKMEKFIYNRAAYVVPLSIGMKRDILTRVPVKNMEVIPNISEIKRFENIKEYKLDFDFKDKRVILYAGTLGPVNDIMYVAKLAKETISIAPEICFLIVGNGKQKESIIAYCRENHILNKNIFFLDPIPKEALPYLYSKVTMGSSFVWDYKIKWDNSANKFFDTLAAGKPILINYQGWQAEVIRENQCGFVLPYRPTSEDIQKFVDYVKDDELLCQQGKNAKVKAKDYSLPVAVEKYLKVFEKVLDNEQIKS